MEKDGTKSPPTGPSGSTFRSPQQRRALIAQLDKTALTYWQALVSEGEPLAEAAVERAYERYAKSGPPA